MANFNFTFQPGISSEQIIGFEVAGHLWGQYLQDDVIFDIHVAQTDNLPPTVVGGALPAYVTTDMATVQSALSQDATSTDDAIAIANLNTQVAPNGSTQYNALLNDIPYQSSNLSITHANAKALGLGSLITPTSVDGYVLFNSFDNSSFTWDYNFSRTSASSSRQIDFLSMALHELGHLMGFVSGVDVIGDISNQANLEQISLLDLFRYSDRSSERSAREITPGEAAYFSIDGGQTQLAPMAAGLAEVFGGIEGYQASHWAYQPPANADLTPEIPEFDLTTALIDLVNLSAPVTNQDAQFAEALQLAEFLRENEVDVGAQTSTALLESARQTTYRSLGIMDPALVPGFRSSISTLDLQALDVIGYNLADSTSSPDYPTLFQETQTSLAEEIGAEVNVLNERLRTSSLIQDRQAGLFDAIVNNQSLFERRRSRVRTRRWVFWQEDGLDPTVVNIVSDGAADTTRIAALEGRTQVTTVQAIPYAQLFFRSDTLTGSDADDYIFPVLPADEVPEINAGGGNDLVFWSDFTANVTTAEGDDTIIGSNSRESTQSTGQNYIDAGAGNNYVLLTSEMGSVKVVSEGGDDYISVGSNNNIIETSGGNNEIYSNGILGLVGTEIESLISNGQITDLSLVSIPSIHQIATGDGNDSIYLLSKESTVTTTGGNNIIHIQGTQNSRITLSAGDGNDEIILIGNAGVVDAGDGNNVVTISSNLDTSERSSEPSTESFFVTTGQGDDVVRLNVARVDVFTGGGNDILDVVAGQQSITTGVGNDLIILGDLQGSYTRFGTQALIADFSNQDSLLLHGTLQDYQLISNSLFYQGQRLATFEDESNFSLEGSQVFFTDTNLGTTLAGEVGIGLDEFAKPLSSLEGANDFQRLEARYNTLREERPLSYAITGGDDAALFSIDPITGAIQFRSAPITRSPRDANEDNIYDVIVQATLGDGQKLKDIDTQRLAITVSSNSIDNSPNPSQAQPSYTQVESQDITDVDTIGAVNDEWLSESIVPESTVPESTVSEGDTPFSIPPSRPIDPLPSWSPSDNNQILGDNEDNLLQGAEGDDTIQAKGGDDAILAGAGNDLVVPTDSLTRGAGENDYVDLGTGQDIVVLGDTYGSYYSANGWADSVYIDGFTTGEDKLVLAGRPDQYLVVDGDANGSWVLLGDDFRTAVAYLNGVTSLDLEGSSVIYAGTTDTSGFETTTANFSHNNASTSESDPVVTDMNLIQGSIGNDALVGDFANDQLLGIGGVDYLEGGAGADQFVLGDANGSFYAQSGWRDSAYIEDFSVGVDQLVLKGAASNYSTESDGQGSFLYDDDDYIAYLKGVTNFDLNTVKYVL